MDERHDLARLAVRQSLLTRHHWAASGPRGTDRDARGGVIRAQENAGTPDP